MNKIYLAFTLFACTVFLSALQKVSAQTLPVGTPVLEDYYRRQQLLGKIDSNVSFTLRPLYPLKSTKIIDVFDPDDKLADDNWEKGDKTEFAHGHGIFQVLPFSWRQQYNSDHPYGWNDGIMIPAKGYQTVLSGGFYFKYGPLSIQLMPEYVYAANLPFNGFVSGHDEDDLGHYYLTAQHNLIDNPERYGTSAYTKFGPGQSSVRLTFGAMSLGLSTENLWWGPGIYNSLIISNNAPGFPHLTINTVKPLNTPIGSFELQIIGGKLVSSGYPNLITPPTSAYYNYQAPRSEWRYYNGFNFNYHPKWIPGLFLGLIRTFNSYHSDNKKLGDYIPFFMSYTKESLDAAGIVGDDIPRDQLTSLSARWLFTKANAELYFEYGLNDNSYNLNDFFGSPEHSRAYTFGLRKLIQLPSKKDEYLMFSGEITQLSQSVDRMVRSAGTWYVHYEVQQGQTNYGQILGSGTGSGGNIQTVELSWVKGLKKLGLLFERYEHDVDYSDLVFPDLNGHSRKWVDFGLGLHGDWTYKNLLINAKIEGVQSLNYEWILKNYTTSPFYIPNNTVFNLHTQLGVSYRF